MCNVHDAFWQPMIVEVDKKETEITILKSTNEHSINQSTHSTALSTHCTALLVYTFK